MSRAIRLFVVLSAILAVVAAWAGSFGFPAETGAPRPEAVATAEFVPAEVPATAAASPAWNQGIAQCLESEDPGAREQWVVVKYGKLAEPVRVGPFRAAEIRLQDTPGTACVDLLRSAR